MTRRTASFPAPLPNAHTKADAVVPSDLPRLIGVVALSRAWGLKPDTIRAMARRGDLPCIHLGRLILFPVDALRELVNDGTKRGNA